ncbi:hypothetical protein SS50377_26132 [Spironucleus salmonicida]|uniref:Uncharacterized protein n=1 Tax=Spironucleus salmonicida TaxID=348837 RepID=V6LQ17_9EUKA|nr:hypothetical protein SS50377_26132 [Spironucleus salmonicida]|eukprot:EST46338.1 Hypothetical protein SS50377_13649 [Spironucleus salmonicida]
MQDYDCFLSAFYMMRDKPIVPLNEQQMQDFTVTYDKQQVKQQQSQLLQAYKKIKKPLKKQSKQDDFDDSFDDSEENRGQCQSLPNVDAILAYKANPDQKFVQLTNYQNDVLSRRDIYPQIQFQKATAFTMDEEFMSVFTQ